MIEFYRQYLRHGKPLRHYYHHYLLAQFGLLGAYFIYGSITVWEMILFLFMSYLPFIDEFFYVTLNYLQNSLCRKIINAFLIGDFVKVLADLHEKRYHFTELILHTIPFYLAMWALWYVAFIFDLSLTYYAVSGLLVHLLFDLANDLHDFYSLRNWLWPFKILEYRWSSSQ